MGLSKMREGKERGLEGQGGLRKTEMCSRERGREEMIQESEPHN